MWFETTDCDNKPTSILTGYVCPTLTAEPLDRFSWFCRKYSFSSSETVNIVYKVLVFRFTECCVGVTSKLIPWRNETPVCRNF